ncbi:MAG: glycosyltransferase family 39 protein [Chloroflexota bacterium]
MLLRRWRLPLLLVILLVGFGVRVLGLGIQDLSDDEAFFVQIAHQGTYLQLAGSAEPHPPLYLALLQGWMFPAGVTEYAVRFLSILFGLATVAAVYQLGRQVAAERLGLAVAAVAAVNPYQIFYSQTTRDYQIACFFGLVSVVTLLWAMRRPKLLPAYVVSVLLAMFSHYYALAIVLFEQALLLGWLWRRHFKGLGRWLAADGCIALVFLPWALYSLRTVANYEPGHGTRAIVADTLRQTFQFDNFGTAFRPGDVVWPTVAVVALLALGAYGLAQSGGGRALGLSLGYQLAPLLFGLVTLLHTTQFGARFLFLGSPGYMLVIAGAIVALARRWALTLAPLAILSGLAGFAIHNTTFSDQFTDKGYSRLAAYLAAHIGQNDSVVLDGISQSLQYWYYAELRNSISQRVAILPLKADGGGADGTPVDLGQTQRALNQLAAGSAGIWLIDDDSLRYDPNLDTQRMLASQASRAFSQGFRGQRLDYYALGSPGSLASVDGRMDGVTLAQASRLDRPVPAGQAIPLLLEWQATRDNPLAFKESLRLLDSKGALVTQDDGAPGAGFWPAIWQAGSSREDRPGLLVPVGTPPGSYKVQLVAYEGASGRPLESPVDLQQVQVDHSAPQRVSAAGLAAADEMVGGERLVRMGLAPEIPAGETLTLTLLWSGGRTSAPESVLLTLGNTRVVHPIGGGTYPTTDWQSRDVVRDVVTIRIPSGMQPGSYPLLASPDRLATVKVLPTKRLFSAPPIAHPLAARFGDVAQLLGYDTNPTPNGVHLRLVWEAIGETTVSYTVFVHALGIDGKIVAQVDVPSGTDNWDAGEVVSADYNLAVNANYTLELGMYDPKTGGRLPVCTGAAGCAQPTDRVELPTS